MFKVEHDYHGFWEPILETKDCVIAMECSNMFSLRFKCDRNYRVIDENGKVIAFDRKRTLVKQLKCKYEKQNFTLSIYNHTKYAELKNDNYFYPGTFNDNKFLSEDGKIELTL